MTDIKIPEYPEECISKELVERLDHYDLWNITYRMDFEAEVISDPVGDGGAAALVDTINNSRGEIHSNLAAYTKNGEYIGDKETADYLCNERRITPTVTPGNPVCNIGFCESEQKWYGWSHRALYGFGIGDEVAEGDCTASSGWTDEYLAEHPEDDLSLPVGFKAKTLEDAKHMAIAFAESVG